MATPSSGLNVHATPWDPSHVFPSTPAAAAYTPDHQPNMSRSSSDLSIDKHISPLSIDVYGARKNSPIISAAPANNYPSHAGELFGAAPPDTQALMPSPPSQATQACEADENDEDMLVYEPPQRSGVVQMGMAFVPDQYAHDEHYIMHMLQADELANTMPYEPDFDSDEDSLDEEQMAWLEEQLRAKEDTYEEIYF